jgi:hypothetical protein
LGAARQRQQQDAYGGRAAILATEDDESSRSPRLRCTARGDASTKLSDPHPVDPLGDHDLGMLAIANFAAENSRAALPAHRLAGTPSRAYSGWPRSRAQLVALACLPRLASG